MSRTYRKVAYTGCFRGIRFKNQRTNTYYWIQELEEEGFYCNSRDRKLASREYLDNYNDIHNSSYSQMKYLYRQISDLLGRYSSRNWDATDYYLEKFTKQKYERAKRKNLRRL